MIGKDIIVHAYGQRVYVEKYKYKQVENKKNRRQRE